MRVNLAGAFDDRDQDIEQLIAELQPIYGAAVSQRWTLSCRKCTYLGPFAVAMVHATWAVGRCRDQSPKIVLPGSPGELVKFCRYSGMEHEFRGGASPDVDHPQNEVLPLTKFSTANWGLLVPLVRLVKRHRPEFGETGEEVLHGSLFEVIQNVCDHSGSPVGGSMSARFMSGTNQVRVAIVDRGVGVLASLRTKYPDTRDILHAFERVIEGNYSAKSRPNNMGLESASSLG